MPKPRALMVEDDPLVRSVYDQILRESDFEITFAFSNKEAREKLDTIAFGKLELDLITTDINHFGDGNGVQLAKEVRNLHDDITVQGGLRLRHLPLVVISGALTEPRVKEIHGIDPKISCIMKPFDIREFLKTLVDAVSNYRNHILSELHHIGYAVAWQAGRYVVLDAYSTHVGSSVESTYFVGESDLLARSYSRLLLIADHSKRGEIAIQEFEALLNSPATSERTMQRFFERHPEFLLRDEFDSYWSEPNLKSPLSGISIKPDFVLQPRGLRDTSWNWAVLDLKRPSVPLLAHKHFHMDLSHYVYRVAAQLRDYSDFFMDPRNQAIIRQRFGGVSLKPKLVAVIGRLPKEHRDKLAVLQSRIQPVVITTYDEILEFRRTKLGWLKSMGL